MYDVTPFKPSFRVFDKDAKRFTGDVFDCPIEAQSFVCGIVKQHPNYFYSRPSVSFTLRLEPDYTYKVWVTRSYREEESVTYGGGIRFRSPRDIYVTKSVPASHYCIIDNFGHVITEADIKVAHQLKYLAKREAEGKSGWHWRDHRNELDKRLEIIKGSPRKIKRNYGTRRIGSWGGNYLPHENSYENEVVSYHRSIRTFSEKKKNDGHCNEYGNEIVRGARRKTYLPDAWDDYPAQVWGQRKCWKHNSKRRKQWVPK